jgi:hypothetical protein
MGGSTYKCRYTLRYEVKIMQAPVNHLDLNCNKIYRSNVHLKAK